MRQQRTVSDTAIREILAERDNLRAAIAQAVERAHSVDGSSRFQVQNAAAAEAEMWLFGDIGVDWFTGEGISASQIADELQGVTAPAITVHLSSPGGDMFEGLAIYDLLKNHPAKVTVQVEGLAASAASLVAMAGDHIVMSRASMMMIHEPAAITIGPAAEHQKTADLLNKFADNMAGIYGDRAGRRVNWRAKMQAETWFTDQEAVSAGLADEVAAKAAVQASFDLSRFKNPPAALVEAVATALDPQQTTVNVNITLDRAAIAAAIDSTDNAPSSDQPPTEGEPIEATSQEPTEPVISTEPEATDQEPGFSPVSARLLIDIAEAEVLAIA